MAAMAGEVASVLGKSCIIVLDAYFSVGPVFSVLKETLDDQGRRLIHVVTRAKSNVVAYEDPVPNPGGVGRPRIYGIKLRLMDLFESMGDRFEKTTIVLYGQRKEVVRSVIQQEYFHNFCTFRNSAIYQIIMSKSRKTAFHAMPLAE